MHIAILGAGPAGLYLAYLIKRRRPETVVTLLEQNPADATFGFGVVFSDRALEFLREDDEATYLAITPHMQSWNDITIIHRGERVTIDGVGFSAIGRLKLLQLLQSRARSVGVEPVYHRSVKSLGELGEVDLIVGADGVSSLVRRSSEIRFGASVRLLSNRFAWFGTEKRFETLTQTFIETDAGSFNAHHYRYSPELSTFIVEVDQLAPIPDRAQRTLVGRQQRSCRRCAAHGTFLDRLGHAPCHGRCDCPREGAGAF